MLDGRFSRVPVVARHARPRGRKLRSAAAEPPPPAELGAVPDALLGLQHGARRARAEARSLSPPYLREIERRLAAERAVEENLERGRRLTREEIRRATDLRRARIDRRTAPFPESRSPAGRLLGMLACGFLAMLAPFLAYFALVAIVAG